MMMMTLSRRALMALAAVSALATSAALAEGQKPVDTSRLVSIGGAVTEIVYALGEGDKLIARDSTSFYPHEAMKLPDVGYMRALSPEGVLSVNPSAILMIQGSGPKETLDVLSKASVPLVTIPEGYDKDAIIAKIKAVGTALNVEDKADDLAAKVAADVDVAQASAAKIPEDKRKRVLFVLTMQNGKIMAAGQHTAADGILKMSGAINATAAFHGYKPLNDETIIEAKPDVILMMRDNGPGVSDAEVLANPAIALTPAGKNRALIRQSGMTLLGFGPRTAEAIRELSKALYGG
ncbi:ABC transporter substrate-binding protein [Rhizobium sp. KVB221]|uniref:ABC transporter substrate-binding protein n=1 Tax=Rhizobium setariae TaxID=2801340 RepID=A0A936YQ73_9HYPH|nr:ABC transporter substrate-binding protein [Rhizobium setariae]